MGERAVRSPCSTQGGVDDAPRGGTGPVWTACLPERLAAERDTGALIVDIRPLEQRARDGELPGAVVVERNALEWRLDPLSDHRIPEMSGHDDRIVIVCNEGYGSSLAAATLHDIGLHRATDLIGGFQAWLALGDHDRDR